MTTLADVKNTEVIPGYHLNVQDHNGFVLLQAPEDYGRRSKPFTHPKLVETRWTLNEYKHYMVYGKKWTKRAGRIYMMFMPLTAMEYDIPDEPAYSYPKVRINGVEVTLNVSGGGSKEWSDFIGPAPHIASNHPHRNLKLIADAALDPAVIADQGLALPEPRYNADEIRFCVAEFETRKALVPGQQVYLNWDVQFEDGGRQRKIRSVNRRRRSVIVEGAWGGVRVKYSQIDWLKTAEINSIELPDIK